MSKLIVELPEDLHQELKKKASSSNKTIKHVVTGLINQYLSAPEKKVAETRETGFCGAWQDERSADDIVADIKKSRHWFEAEKELA